MSGYERNIGLGLISPYIQQMNEGLSGLGKGLAKHPSLNPPSPFQEAIARMSAGISTPWEEAMRHRKEELQAHLDTLRQGQQAQNPGLGAVGNFDPAKVAQGVGLQADIAYPPTETEANANPSLMSDVMSHFPKPKTPEDYAAAANYGRYSYAPMRKQNAADAARMTREEYKQGQIGGRQEKTLDAQRDALGQRLASAEGIADSRNVTALEVARLRAKTATRVASFHLRGRAVDSMHAELRKVLADDKALVGRLGSNELMLDEKGLKALDDAQRMLVEDLNSLREYEKQKGIDFGEEDSGFESQYDSTSSSGPANPGGEVAPVPPPPQDSAPNGAPALPAAPENMTREPDQATLQQLGVDPSTPPSKGVRNAPGMNSGASGNTVPAAGQAPATGRALAPRNVPAPSKGSVLEQMRALRKGGGR